MKAIKAISLSVLFVVVLSLTVPVRAQAPQDCKFDLSDITKRLADAQSKQKAGQLKESLALLEQIQQDIAEIQTRCGDTGAPALTSKFVEPSGAFEISYPTGWITQSLADTPSERERGNPITFASDSTALQMITEGKSGINSRAVVVFTGNAKQMLEQLGAHGKDKLPTSFTAKSLLDVIVSGQNSRQGKFGAVTQGASISDYATAEAAFIFSDQSGTIVSDGGILLVQVSTDKFAALVGFAPAGESKSVMTLARAMAVTLRVPAKATP